MMISRNIALLFLAAAAFVHAVEFEPTGRTIVTLRPNTNQRTFDRELKQALERDTSAGPGDNRLVYQYTGEFAGYAGHFTDAMIEQLRSNPSVASIEQDTYGTFDDSVEDAKDLPNIPKLPKLPKLPNLPIVIPNPTQAGAPWGLVRVSQRKRDLTKSYVYPASAGSGITAYVIDSGIDTTHPAFEGRASWGANFVKGEGNVDGASHGSHVAGTIGSKVYGVAKKAKLVALKVCSSAGQCASSDVIAALQWVTKNATKLKSVVNISLKLAPSDAVDAAVKAAVNAGIAVIVSGGNDNGNSCINSPRRAPEAFAVGASDNADKKAAFSNHGKCIRLFAPGVGIVSTIPGNKTGSKSGTSMASPHVAGVAALYLASKRYNSVFDLHKDLLARATKNVIMGVPANTSTNLIYSLPTGGEPSE